MQPKIETLKEKKLVGKRLTMTFDNNQTFKLWQSFIPRRKEILNNVSADLISMQIYPHSFDFTFADPRSEFEKWAAIEVADFDNVPTDMETIIVPGGLYAVFLYKGSSTDNSIFQYIFGTWLPGSNYMVDNRPHFEVLGENYKNNDPRSEEKIWIPVRPKEIIHEDKK
jgi:AraC family transcriptional regulator